MKKFFSYILMLCLIIPCAFMITACGDNDNPGGETGSANALKQVAGTYSLTTEDVYSNEVKITTNNFAIDKDGKFNFTVSKKIGIKEESTSLLGTIALDDNGKVIDVKLSNFAKYLTDAKETIYGTEVKQDSLLEGLEELFELFGFDKFQSCIEQMMEMSLQFANNYVMLYEIGLDVDLGDPIIMYKSGTAKLAEGTILKTYTEKEYRDLYKNFALFDDNKLTYATDVYFEKNAEIDLTNNATRKDFASGVELGGIVIQEDGSATMENLSVVDITGLNLTDVGTGNAVITYETGKTTTTTRNITYTVVASRDDFPTYKIREMSVTGDDGAFSEINYITKGTELYNLNWRLDCKAYNSGGNKIVPIDETTCVSEGKVVTITNYDKNKIGLQIVTFTYKGVSSTAIVYVYDEADIPVVGITAVRGSMIYYTEDVETGEMTYDLTEAKYEEVLADGSKSEPKAVTIDMLRGHGYTEKNIIVSVVIDGKTYTYTTTISMSKKSA